MFICRYDEIKQRYPEEYMKRERNKLEYRYPDGESYIDVKDRLSQVLMKIVGCRDSVLIVGHIVGDWYILVRCRQSSVLLWLILWINRWSQYRICK